MKTSTSHSTSPEGWQLSEDDRPQREAARVKILVRELGPVSAELRQHFPSLEWNAQDIAEILTRYKSLRDEAARLMKGYSDPGHLLVIDRHKVGAAFMLAILDVSPLKLKQGHDERYEGERLANAILAFRTAIRILAAFSHHEGRTEKNTALAERWRRTVVYPEPRVPGKYTHHVYRALFHGHKQGRLNLPMLANWLFIIEQYNNMANP